MSIYHSPSCRFIVISLHILYHTGQHFQDFRSFQWFEQSLSILIFLVYQVFPAILNEKNGFIKIIIKNELVSMLCQRKVLFIMEGAKEDYYY